MAAKVRIGAELFCAADLRQALDAARQDGLDFACSPLSHPRNARDARGVSERESALIQELIYGSTLREAADRLGIAYNTARNQLASVHTKTGTRSQSDVVRLGAQILARLPGAPEHERKK